ncbi:tudor domain-containing protein 5 isoform X2 [Antennarius striatus]|uniref:tudor domain-containing protein 5 isoform X2 n=1 Tax=Antennarius striatus TaxID=241820 RepID=UPI0035B2547F
MIGSAGTMDQENLLANLKKDVRSLLVSSKFGLDPEQLRRDYISMMGHPMPLKQLGFHSIMEMVKEMPDVVSINFSADSVIILKAVSDESTKNMEQLVAKQRMSKTDKKIRRGGFRNISYLNKSIPALPPRRGRAPLAIPAQLKAQLRILLSQGGLRLCELESSYLRCFGLPLRPHSYGFFSIGEMLGAAADLVTIYQGSLGSIVALKQHMYPRPLTTWSQPSKRRGIKQAVAPRAEESSPGSQVPVNPISPEQPAVEASLGPAHKESSSVSHEREADEKKEDGDPERHQDAPCFQKRVTELKEELRLKILENGVTGSISQELKDRLQEVVGQATGGLSVHDIPTEYKRLFGEDVPLRQNGFVSVTELISNMCDTFHLKLAENDNGNDWIVTCIQESDLSVSGSKETKSSDNGGQPSTGDVLSFGASDWERNKNDFETTEEKERLETIKDSKRYEMRSEIKPVIEVRCSSSVPLDALQGQRLKKPTPHAARQLMDVWMEEVKSPGNFYICFTNSEEARAMDSLMLEMRRCYANPEVSRRYQLPERFVRQGQVCCMSTNTMWFYRVVIHQIVSPTHVMVYFVDFGNVDTVPTAHLKFLKSCYSLLPAQAVPSSLAGIKPNSGSWTAGAIASFQKLCSHRVFVGALDCYVGDVLQLYLCDTSTDKDIYIHTALLSQGHGTACSPAASTELCVLDGPVSLYLGEGKVDLPELEEETSPSPNPVDMLEQFKLAPQKGNSTNLPNEQTCSPTDVGLVQTNPSSPTSTPLSIPDQIQPEMNQAHCEGDFKTLTLAPPPAPPSISSNSCCPVIEEEQHPPLVTDPSLVGLPPVLRILEQGSPHHLQKTGVMFPLFGARWVEPSSLSSA